MEKKIFQTIAKKEKITRKKSSLISKFKKMLRIKYHNIN